MLCSVPTVGTGHPDRGVSQRGPRVLPWMARASLCLVSSWRGLCGYAPRRGGRVGLRFTVPLSGPRSPTNRARASLCVLYSGPLAWSGPLCRGVLQQARAGLTQSVRASLCLAYGWPWLCCQPSGCRGMWLERIAVSLRGPCLQPWARASLCLAPGWRGLCCKPDGCRGMSRASCRGIQEPARVVPLALRGPSPCLSPYRPS